MTELATDETGEVMRLTLEGEARRRLMDLGLVPGSKVTPVFQSPLGDPTSYRIRGALIALRKVQACQIIVRRVAQHER